MPTAIPAPGDIHSLALAAIPGYSTTKDRLARLEQFDVERTRQLNREIPLRVTALQDAILTVADGADVDVRAIAQEINDLQAQLSVEALVVTAADVARSRLRQESRDLDDTAKDAALAWLDGVIRDLAAEVRQLDSKLGSIGSWSSASRGTPDQLLAWQRLDQLVDTVDAIRHAQRTIVCGTNAGGPVTLDRMHQVGFLADQIDHDRYWIRRRLDAVRTVDDGSKHQPYIAWLNPWKSPDEVNAQAPLGTLTDSWWPDEDKHAYLRWVASNATLWVPSVSQAEAALKAAMTAMQPTGLADAHEYFRITGATPVTPLPALADGPTATSGMTWEQYKRDGHRLSRVFR